MFGKESPYEYRTMNFEEQEPAFRYGASARQHFGEEHKSWDPTLRNELKRSYTGNWDRDEPLIRYAYGYPGYR